MTQADRTSSTTPTFALQGAKYAEAKAVESNTRVSTVRTGHTERTVTCSSTSAVVAVRMTPGKPRVATDSTKR